MLILRHFRYYIYDETLRTEVHFIILSTSQLRTDVHSGSFCHNNEFARFRTEDHSCSVLVHLSFAPQFIFGHFVTISNSKHCAPRSIFFIFSESQLRTEFLFLVLFGHVITIQRSTHCAPRSISVHLQHTSQLRNETNFWSFISISRSKHCALNFCSIL